MEKWYGETTGILQSALLTFLLPLFSSSVFEGGVNLRQQCVEPVHPRDV
jgi:hypothetical protein